MAEQEKKPGGADGKKKKFYNGRFARGAKAGRLVVILDGSLFYVTVSFENYTSV